MHAPLRVHVEDGDSHSRLLESRTLAELFDAESVDDGCVRLLANRCAFE